MDRSNCRSPRLAQAIRGRPGGQQLQVGPLVIGEAQGVGEQAHGVVAGAAGPAGLQVPDRANAQTREIGELLLGQPRTPPPRKEKPRNVVFVFHEAPPHRRPPNGCRPEWPCAGKLDG